MRRPEGPGDSIEGVDGFIEFPVYPSSLYNELGLVFERMNSERAGSIEIQPLIIEGSKKALVVDDNEANIEIAASCLKRMGIRTDRAGSGEEALSAFRTGLYDLVLVDLTLDGMDGFETARHLREMELEHRSRVPILAMSAAPRIGLESRLQAAGFDDFIAKPVNFEKLEDTIARWLRSGLAAGSGMASACTEAEASESGMPSQDSVTDRSRIAFVLRALLEPVKDAEPALCDPLCTRLRSVPWPVGYADRLAAIASHVDNFRFGDAQSLIESLLEALDKPEGEAAHA
jgi:CheY-like chemotaxis protein